MFSLVIPTFNEAGNIEKLCFDIAGILKEKSIDFEIIVVDDNSSDGTGQIAEAIAEKEKFLKVIKRTDEKDLSTAVMAGWKAAQGDILGVIDADFQHPPELLPLMLRNIFEDKDADIVIASRYKKGGGVSVLSIWRKFVSRFGILLSNFLLPGVLTKVNDPMSGFFILRRSVIRDKQLTPKGYKILLEVLVKGDYKGILEVPFIFGEREKGGSKLSIKQHIKFLSHIYRLSLQTKELLRVIKYICVGILGIPVTLITFFFSLKFIVNPYLSYLLALELATVNNFLLNEFWTFRDKSILKPSLKARGIRFLEFNLICFSGALLNFFVFFLLVRILGLDAIAGVISGTIAAFIWNFLGSANIAWFFKIYHRV